MSNYFPPQCSLDEDTHVPTSTKRKGASTRVLETIVRWRTIAASGGECASSRREGAALSLSPGISGVLGDTTPPLTDKVARDTSRIKVTEKKNQPQNEHTSASSEKKTAMQLPESKFWFYINPANSVGLIKLMENLEI